MKLIDITKTANGNVWGSKARSILTMCAIFIGALVLTLSVAIGEGTKEFVDVQTKNFALTDTLIVTGNKGGIQVSISGLGSEPEEYNTEKNEDEIRLLKEEDRLKILNVENVESVTPDYYVSPKYLEISDKKFETSLQNWSSRMNLKYAAGEQLNLDNTNDIILGYGFTGALGVDSPDDLVGKNVSLVFNDPKGKRPDEVMNFKVVGVVASSIVYNSTVLISHENAEQAYLYVNDLDSSSDTDYYSYNAYLKQGLSTEESQKVRDEIGNLGYGTSTVEEEAGEFKSLVSTVQAGLAGFSLIAILAASFGIINTLLMSVYERINEIGLMKALGMKSKGIFTLFAIEAAVIGFWGSISGVVIAILAGQVINNVASTTFLKGLEGFTLLIFPVNELILIVIGIMIVAFLAGTIPAIKAMRLKPIEALRYE